MNYLSVVVLSILITGYWSAEQLKLPEWLKIGAASAAYQVEGAWNVGDKGVNMWDKLLHDSPELVADGSNGDVACDSYHLWRRDIEMCEELGLQIYRFSISWTRLLPTGYPNYISEDGKNYYNNLIDGLLQKGIEPLVTIYHWDLPQSLQDLGGWANPLIADWFVDYANVVFSLYGDRVKYWITINEPIAICDGGYGNFLAPHFEDLNVGRFLCNKNLLVAHARAYRLYDELYRVTYRGKLSLANLFFWFEPATPEDQEVTELSIEYWEGRYAYPIFSKEGGWPPKLEKILAENARKEGYHYRLPPFSPEEIELEGRYAYPIFSKEGGWPPKLEKILAENARKEGYHYRLPPFSPEEIELVRGTYDYYALNHYTTRLVRKVKPEEKAGAWLYYGSDELDVTFETDPTWEMGPFDWFGIYPKGLRSQLHWLNSTYDVKEIMITENGVASDAGLEDTQRLEYYRDYLEQVLLAINDGINVTGYVAWTLMDNFEWIAGYESKFGLYAVDFTDPNRTRTPRVSALYLSTVTRTRSIYPKAI